MGSVLILCLYLESNRGRGRGGARPSFIFFLWILTYDCLKVLFSCLIMSSGTFYPLGFCFAFRNFTAMTAPSDI